jgi:spermidine synthase
MSAILLQLLQTRVFSVAYWNHLVYFIVSIALLGYGISGTWLSFGRTQRLARILTLPMAGLAFVVAAIISTFLLPHQSPLDAFAGMDRVASLFVTYGLAVSPYFFAGWILGTLYRDRREDANWIYFADLSGAATGCLLFLTLIRPLGAGGLIALISLLACFAICWVAQPRRRAWPVVVALVVVACLSGIFRGRLEARVIPEPSKAFNALYTGLEPGDARVVEYTEWNSISRVDVVSTRNRPTFKRFFIDGDAITRLAIPDAMNTFHSLDGAFVLRPKPSNALIIGSGGGYDVRRAFDAGAKHTDAVEINPSTVSLVSERYRSDCENLFQRPEVSLILQDGRSFILRTDTHYDLITLTCIDSFAALNSGAYVLSENYLYTTNAVSEYVERLTPGGVLFISRWLYKPEAVRLFATAIEAMERANVREPEKCILAYEKKTFALYISNEPFSSGQIAALDAFSSQIDARRIYPSSESTSDEIAADLTRFLQMRADGRVSEFYDTYFYHVRPVTDDSPFFFQYDRLRNLGRVFEEKDTSNTQILIRGHWPSFTLFVLLGLTSIATLVFIIAPLLRRRSTLVGISPLWFVYFIGLGLAFISVEIALMQRFALFLGHPSLSLASVLAGLLVAAGIGSVLGRNWFHRNPTAVFAGLLIGIVGATFLYPVLMAALLPLPLPVRIACTLVLVGCVGIFMGIPFPSGLRALARQSEDAVPWMWGVNGGSTVIGSVLAIILAIQTSFTVVLMTAAVCYAISGLVYLRLCRSQSAQAEAPRSTVGVKGI